MPLPRTPRRRKPGGYGIRPYGAPRGLHFPGWPPCFPGSVGRAFTPAANRAGMESAPHTGCAPSKSNPWTLQGGAAKQLPPPCINPAPVRHTMRND